MASSEDMDWLYDRKDPKPQPDSTQVMPAATSERPPAAPPQPVVGPPSAGTGRPAAGSRPVDAPLPPRPPLPPPQPARPPRRHPRTYWARRIFALLLVVLLAWVAFLILTPLDAFSHVTRMDATPDGSRPAGQVGTAILITGSDSREGLSPADADRLGVGGDEDAGRTDTMMLLYTPPSGRSVLISLPRDSYVEIPGHGSSKLNAAYAWGGAPLLVQTVEHDTGMRIDGFAEVGFAGFALLVDAVDGVDVCVAEDIPAESVYPEIKAGCQTLDAPQALWYVRSRHSAAMQDLDRIQRQRTFMAALMKKLATPETVLNPVRYWEVTHKLAAAIHLGKDTSLPTTLALATGMQNIASGKGFAMSMPISDPDYETDAGSSVLWDDQATAELFAQLKRGDTSNLEKYVR